MVGAAALFVPAPSQTDELMKVTNEYLTSTRDYVMATNKSLAAEAGVVARAKHRPVLHAPQETPCRIWASQPMDAIDPCQIEELFQDEAEVLDVLLPESLLERRVKQVAEVCGVVWRRWPSALDLSTCFPNATMGTQGC